MLKEELASPWVGVEPDSTVSLGDLSPAVTSNCDGKSVSHEIKNGNLGNGSKFIKSEDFSRINC